MTQLPQVQTILFFALLLLADLVVSTPAARSIQTSKGDKKGDSSSSDEEDDEKDTDEFQQLIPRDLQCQEYINGVKAMFVDTVFPRNIEILNNAALPEIFDPNVQGRAQPLGAFSGFNNTLEYFYALTLGDYLLTSSTGLEPKFVNIASTFRYIACDVDQRLGIFSGNLNFGRPGVDVVGDLPAENLVHFTGGARFNVEGRVCGYELNLARLGIFLAQKDKVVDGNSQEDSVALLCLGVMHACTGNNQQYESFQDCASFMNSIDYGSFDNADLNNVNCRRLHVQLALSRPDDHCAHTGKDGGGKCIDRDYTNTTDGDYLLGLDGC